MKPEFRDALEKARSHLLNSHEEVIRDLMDQQGREYHEIMLTLATLARSKSLTRGFFDLMLSHNLTTAGALLRLQLDNLLRLVGLFIAADRHQFFEAMLEGQNMSQFRDSMGSTMTDRYLRQYVAAYAPWINGLYKQGSGFIHFSHRHLRAVIDGKKPQEIGMYLADDESHIPDDSYDSVAGAFGLASHMLLGFIYETSDAEDLKAQISPSERASRALARMAKHVGEALNQYAIPATPEEIQTIPEAERR